MDFALSWNLVLLSSFVLAFAYNFILGQNATVKLIISTYIAILTADGVADILKIYVFDVAPGFNTLVGDHKALFFIVLRIALFLISIVVFSMKGGFVIELEKHEHWAFRGFLHAIFAVLSGALFIATVLIYLSGNSFVEGMLFASNIEIYKESFIAQILIDYYQVWFSLPAITFLVTSFLFERKNT